MKLFKSQALVLFMTSSFSQTVTRPTLRRYSQWTDQIIAYNPNFSDFTTQLGYIMYGCNCIFAGGDNNLGQETYGNPIDAIDDACKTYKTCLSCVVEKFGSSCVPERIEYAYSDDSGFPVCTNRENSCARSICECDNAFAYSHNEVKDKYNPNFSHFFGSFNPDVCPNICPKSTFEISGTNTYTGNTAHDGEYEEIDSLVGDHKCYHDGSNFIQFWDHVGENGAWVITDETDAIFVAQDDIPCPHTANWFYAPNGINDLSNLVSASDLRFGGLSPPEATASNPASDPQCCGGSSSPMLIYNANTQECCHDGSITSVGGC